MKKCPKWLQLFGIILQRQVGYMLKTFRDMVELNSRSMGPGI